MNATPTTQRAHRHRRRMAGAVLGLSLFAAACGDSSDSTSDSVGDDPTATTAVAQVSDDEMSEGEGEMSDEMTDEMSDEMTDEMSDEMTDEMDEMTDEMSDEMSDGVPLNLSFTGLEPLGADAVYEGWVIVEGEPVSTGRFAIDDTGATVAVAGEDHSSTVAHPEDAEAVVITIEPLDDPDPAPAATHVLAGDVVDGTAELTVSHPAALGVDFAEASGTFILGTPTDGDGNNELSGVWFIDLPLAQGLDLPTLPEGWAYEGWAVIDGVPVTTGQFLDPGAADEFDGFSGSEGGPPFPGEDFIINAPEGLEFPTDLTGATVVISVEPTPDDSPAPFAIKPLVAEVPAGTGDHQVLDLGAGPALPSGTATIG